ncbi:MAG: Rv1355c family protein [Niabella sp.]|nr:Rv1355c family protein [Niabella sp.]
MNKKATAEDSVSLKDLNTNDHTYRPLFFRTHQEEDRRRLNDLRATIAGLEVYDQIAGQIREIVKLRYFKEIQPDTDFDALTTRHLGGVPIEDYGVWVYYPWSRRLVHLLDEDEFIEVRTSRNKYKITPEESALLRTKKIGVVGLSVGQSIAFTLAMERGCGALHLADFDNIELSNMNRLNVEVHNIGINKAVLAGRKIAELDPFISVTCFEDGITDENIDAFFERDGRIDVLVEECDGIDVKISSRLKARALKIPVVMDTNDRGMLDIERFDLEPDRPLFHGNLDESIDLKNLKQLTNHEKLPLLDAMVNLSSLSPRMKYSLGEMGKSISTWPQLASSVMLGGAMVADTCRRILLSEIETSGRYYVDFSELIK